MKHCNILHPPRPFLSMIQPPMAGALNGSSQLGGGDFPSMVGGGWARMVMFFKWIK